VYAWTVAPTVTLVDSGELIVAARSLGVAHPPGFPLYVLLSHIASLIPIGSVAARVNFASAVFGAAAASLLAAALFEAAMTRATASVEAPGASVARKRRRRRHQSPAAGQKTPR